MFDPVSLAWLLGTVITLVVILFTIQMFRDWVKEHIGNYRNQSILNGMVRQSLHNGDFKITQFLYNDDTQQYVEQEAIQASFLDDELNLRLGDKDVFVEEVSQ